MTSGYEDTDAPGVFRRAEVIDLRPRRDAARRVAASGVGALRGLLDVAPADHQVLGVGRVHLELRREHRAGQQRVLAVPGLAAVLAGGHHAAGVLLVDDVGVVGIDRGEEAVAAEDGVALAARLDLALAVVLEAHVGGAVLGHSGVVGLQGVQAAVVAVAPAARVPDDRLARGC